MKTSTASVPHNRKPLAMTAADLVSAHGPHLLGRRVTTQPMGAWEGGDCDVVQLEPDPNAPEIAFQVRRATDGATIGVFAREPVVLQPPLEAGEVIMLRWPPGEKQARFLRYAKTGAIVVGVRRTKRAGGEDYVEPAEWGEPRTFSADNYLRRV